MRQKDKVEVEQAEIEQVEAEAAAVSEEEAEQEEVEAAAQEAGPAARVSAAAWWCPNDDRAMALDVAACDVCGFERI